MQGAMTLRRLLLPLLDGTALVGSLLAAMYLRFDQNLEEVLGYDRLPEKVLLNASILMICLYYSGAYEDWPLQRPIETLFRFVRGFTAGLVVLLVIYYSYPPLTVGRGILILSLIFSLLSVLSIRGLYRWLGEEDGFGERLLILGTGTTAQNVAREILKRRPWGLRVVGFLGDDPAQVGHRLVNPTVVGTMDELYLLARRLKAGIIVVALDDRRGKMPVDDLLRCRIEGLRVEEGASILERLTGQIPIKNLRPSWLVFSQGFDESRMLRSLKAAGEMATAAALLVLFAPAMILTALAVKITSPGPVIYRQERVGRAGKLFQLLKFRTMRSDAEAATGPIWSTGDRDPRITRLGRLLRKTRLDELPQLVNVLRGDMSFVGPRPERPHFVSALRQVIPLYDERHSVRPGITGWAQINAGYGSSIEDAELKLQYDLYYIKHMSFAFDIGIMIDTLKVVAIGRGAR